jgi:hypothetical protein
MARIVSDLTTKCQSERPGGVPEAGSPKAEIRNPNSQRPRYEFTPEQDRLAIAAFEKALDDSVLPYDVGQLGLFHEDDETFIQREIERLLYEQKLPDGGDKERSMIERLEDFVAKIAKINEGWTHLGRLHHAISQWKLMLPDNPRNAGRYYTRRALTPKDDKEFFSEMITTRNTAAATQEWDRKWFAAMMLEGLPTAVSDFEIECLFLLRRSDGSVTRLVRLRNIVGEVSRGEHAYGAVILDEDAFASPENFRKWCLRWGPFNWSGNQTALHLLHEDIGRLSAWKVIERVDYPGWVRVKREN